MASCTRGHPLENRQQVLEEVLRISVSCVERQPGGGCAQRGRLIAHHHRLARTGGARDHDEAHVGPVHHHHEQARAPDDVREAGALTPTLYAGR